MTNSEPTPEGAPEDIKQSFWHRHQNAIVIAAAAIGAGAATWYGFTHDTSPPRMPTEYVQAEYERHLGDQISETVGIEVTVSCPADVAMSVGTTFTCAAMATVDGSRAEVTVIFEESGYAWSLVGDEAG